MKTLHLSTKETKRSWHLVDASQYVLGRLSSKVAGLLIGKHKVSYSQNLDAGDFVVVVNAEKIKVTGKKADKKVYRSHSGYPKGFKELKYSEVFAKDPTQIIRHSVLGMLPDNRLKRERVNRLNIVVGEVNPFKEKFNLDEKN